MNYYCPRCGGELDTGMTCSACAQHWQARSAPDPDSGPKVTMDQVHVFLDNGIPFGISPHYLSDWLRSIVAGVVALAVFVGLVGFGAGVSIGYRWGERETARVLRTEIDLLKSELSVQVDENIYLREWATFKTLASHYGGDYHNGRLTASGRPFDENELTAASPWLPFGKRVKVTNIKNGLSVMCTITDRGPAPRLGRGLDLSTAAARAIGMLHDGVIPVELCPGI